MGVFSTVGGYHDLCGESSLSTVGDVQYCGGIWYCMIWYGRGYGFGMLFYVNLYYSGL